MYTIPLSEFLEHLASDNGADMHKYNTLYTHKLDLHVLTPELLYISIRQNCVLNKAIYWENIKKEYLNKINKN